MLRSPIWPRTSLWYAYNASAHSPLSSCVSCLLGSAGGGVGEAVAEAVDPVEGTRLGGGAKSVLRLNAEGVGGATCAGPAFLAAVEPRMDENIFLPELMSTSPNF